MRLVMFAVVTAALAMPAQAEEVVAAGRPTLAAQGQSILANSDYSRLGGWQARVSKARNGRGSTKRAIIIGAAAGAAAGLVTGLVLENQSCGCGSVGPWAAGLAAVGAGAGAGVGWVVSLR